MALPGFLGSSRELVARRVPRGGAGGDYIPLLAVLARRLSNDEVQAVASELIATGELPVDNIDIGAMITKFTDELPRDRMSTGCGSKLSAHGWPLAEPRAS